MRLTSEPLIKTHFANDYLMIDKLLSLLIIASIFFFLFTVLFFSSAKSSMNYCSCWKECFRVDHPCQSCFQLSTTVECCMNDWYWVWQYISRGNIYDFLPKIFKFSQTVLNYVYIYSVWTSCYSQWNQWFPLSYFCWY